MSSAISTKDADNGLRPWQLFVLVALACATALTWMARSQGVIAVVLLSVLMGAVALTALALLRTVSPLVSPRVRYDRTATASRRESRRSSTRSSGRARVRDDKFSICRGC